MSVAQVPNRHSLTHVNPVSAIAMRVIFPLMAAIGFHADNIQSLYPLVQDAATLHITAWAVEGFIDRILRRHDNIVNPAAMLHFQKGLRILRERLLSNNDAARLSDSTISVVLKLANAAHFDGDYEASRQHMEGLRKIVDLRGGLDTFKGNKLLSEMLR